MSPWELYQLFKVNVMNVINELGLSNTSYRIFSIFPDLDMACASALAFVGCNFPGKSKPLIYEMFMAAFDAYQNAEQHDRNVRQEFIKGLCSLAYLLYQVRYCSEKSQKIKVWIPMVQSITSFEQSYAETYVRNEPDPQSVGRYAASLIFAARILPGHLFAEVFKQELECDNV